MVRIFKDSRKGGSGEFVVQTTCLDCDAFVSELAEALTSAITEDDGGVAALSILQKAMPIAFKLSGYKAENVNEQRTLVCGFVSPENSQIVATAGK
jgi:hypothetical protein